MWVMIGTALVAAILYGAGAAIEQHQAAAIGDDSAGKPKLLVQLARNPLWLLGFAVQSGGFAAHAVALRTGPLAMVQMIIALELIVAVLLVRLWSGRSLNRTSWAAALIVMAGIAAFLFLTTSAGHEHAHDLPRRVLLAAAVLGVSSAATLLMGLRSAPGNRRALLLAVAAGLGDSVMAVVTMAFAHTASHGLAAILTSWTSYGLVAGGIWNLLLTQTAYQAARPMITLPAISAVTPVASVIVGIAVLGEAPRISPGSAAGAALAVLATSAGLAILARSAPRGAPATQHASGRPIPVGPVPAQQVSPPVRRVVEEVPAPVLLAQR
jgi:hypothetical protein